MVPRELICVGLRTSQGRTEFESTETEPGNDPEVCEMFRVLGSLFSLIRLQPCLS